MEGLKDFLESSTIHGLTYISTTRKLVRPFWVLIVIAGFSAAGLLIYQSFQSWAESPVRTTIETLPINEITFPKVTVCPPKNTFTDLNYDLKITENMTLNNDTRIELANYAMELLYDQLHINMLRNVSKLEEKDRYHNWYHGYTQVKLGAGDIYNLMTVASSGSISTKHFGEEFDAAKVETKLTYTVYVRPPVSVSDNPNSMLHIDLQKVSMKDLSSGHDKTSVYNADEYNMNIVETSHTSYNHSPPTHDSFRLYLERDVIPADIMKQKLDQMPGFKVSWYYSGIEVEPEAKYQTDNRLMAFVRHYSNNTPDYLLARDLRSKMSRIQLIVVKLELASVSNLKRGSKSVFEVSQPMQAG